MLGADPTLFEAPATGAFPGGCSRNVRNRRLALVLGHAPRGARRPGTHARHDGSPRAGREGLWLNPGREAGLAFRRLAIIDLSATANQPMANEDGSVQVVSNGEIYNHLELRRELLARGHRFRTDHSDTEVIVHGYEEWGAGVVERLHGMFGVGIWDQPRRRLFLARDRVGVKPLYFGWTPNAFVFASEIKALLSHPEVQADMESVSCTTTSPSSPPLLR